MDHVTRLPYLRHKIDSWYRSEGTRFIVTHLCIRPICGPYNVPPILRHKIDSWYRSKGTRFIVVTHLCIRLICGLCNVPPISATQDRLLALQINGRFPWLGNPWKPMETQFPMVSTWFHTVSIGFPWQTRKCRFSLTNTQLYMGYKWGAIGHTSSASVAYCLPKTYM